MTFYNYQPSRTRSKTRDDSSYYYFINGQKGYYQSPKPVTFNEIKDRPTRPSNCYHHRLMLYDGHDVTINGNPHYAKAFSPYGYPYWDNHVYQIMAPARERAALMYNDLDWSKLRHSNQFALIQFIAELDETLLTFTKKFWKQFSYGSFTWGLLPLVSEIESIINQVKRLMKSYDPEKGEEYTDIIEEELEYPFIVPNERSYTCYAKVKTSNRGRVFPPDLLDPDAIITNMYDVLGFHPSLSTVWDLIPLSFLVDYLLPIGDFLDSLKHSEGWTTHVLFQGWSSSKIVVYVKDGLLYDGVTSLSSHFGEYEYSRQYRSVVLNDVEYKPKIDWFEYPSLKELFNLWYILGPKHKVLKGI